MRSQSRGSRVSGPGASYFGVKGTVLGPVFPSSRVHNYMIM